PSPAVSSASLQQRKKEATKRRKKFNREGNEKIARLEKKLEKYKKRLARFKSKNKKNVEDTPKTKMLKMLEEPDQRKEVVKKALFGDVISKQLKENYSTLKRTKEKQIFKKVVTGSIVQKYRYSIPKEMKSLSRPGKKSNLNGLDKLLEDICCDRYNVNCLARLCHICLDKNPKYKEFDNKNAIKYKMWISERQQIQDFKTKKPRLVTKCLKKTFEIHPRQLIIHLQKDLHKFLDHQRNIVHQYKAMNDMKSNLQDDEVLIHIDFSENYCTKYAEEIQAFHFGGSRAQLSLHTVVVYLRNSILSLLSITRDRARRLGIICIAIDGKDIQAMVDKVEEEAADQKGFKGTLNVHQVAGVYSSSILGLPTKCKTLTMKNLSCFCNSGSCEHYKIGTVNFALKPRWTVEEVFTESEPEDHESAKPELTPTPNKSPQRLDDVVAGPSGIRNSCYNTGDYVLVKYAAKNVEYRYAAVINNIDNDENDLRVTFLKICDQKVQIFDQLFKKLDNPNLILKEREYFIISPAK
ncbi:hypothetical protein SFRURICE_021557, partial [Spodoptera frugiperda]